MKVKALDQLHVSSVRAAPFSTNEEFEVSDEEGKALIARGLVAKVGGEKKAAAPKNKKAAAPRNKKAAAPKNKSA